MKNTSSIFILLFMMIAWWIFWLSLSIESVTGIYPPRESTILQFSIFIVCLIVGFVFSFSLNYKKVNISLQNNITTKGFSHASNFILLLILLVLLFSMYFSGFFSIKFIDYHQMVRMQGYGDYLTGSKLLDLLVKILIYPLIVSYCLVHFSNENSKIKNYLVFPAVILYSLLWQVNYPVILLFWLAIFKVFIVLDKPLSKKLKPFMYIFLIGILLLLSATLRYGAGEFSQGVIEHYLINYHIIGFSFYDQQLMNTDSLLHEHTFGRSSLGFFEQILDLVIRPLGFDWSAASFENRDYNMTTTYIGDDLQGNAFGTLLFTFYRDFSFLGIILGGLVYGFFVCKYFMMSRECWRSRAILLLLLYSWFTGMMVSPIEQGYFWFSVIFILIFSRFKVGGNA